MPAIPTHCDDCRVGCPDEPGCQNAACHCHATPDHRATLLVLIAHVQKERDFNEGWIAVHLAQGKPAAAERRREIVRERDVWLAALTAEIEGRTERDREMAILRGALRAISAFSGSELPIDVIGVRAIDIADAALCPHKWKSVTTSAATEPKETAVVCDTCGVDQYEFYKIVGLEA